MEITLAEQRLMVRWPRYDRVTHDEIVARLKAIRGATFDKTQGVWFVPVKEADRLLAAFPKASYDYDALCAALDRQDARIGIFAESLLAMGIELVDTFDGVRAVGAGVSPLLQDIVKDRSMELRRWIASKMPANPYEYGCGLAEGVKKVESIHCGDSEAPDACNHGYAVSGESEDWRQAELLATGLRNAAKNQRQEDAMRQRRRRRRGAA